MGTSNSRPEEQHFGFPDSYKMDHHQMDGTYPDMNYIFFKGVPKMMQVADDMHRMTDYIMDLRNMTIGILCLSFLGALLFLFLRYVQKRNDNARRTRLLISDQLEDLESGKHSIQSHCGTYRGYPDPWHDATMKTPAIILDKERFTSSSPPTMTTDGYPEDTPRLANGRINTNRGPICKEKGIYRRTE